ncbi:MAG: TonB-dependent receptor [Bryobacterales bacterium]|nr:TonB-dependent receptor [Bryobacterales bacterium]
MSCIDSFRARRLSAALRSCGFISVALAATVLSLPMGAQESRATIAGRVTDASDSVVVGANIVAANVNTGVSVSATSNESGTFVIPFLLPGTYRVTAGMAGFKTYAQDEIRLRVNDSLDLKIRLEVGAVTETMSVTAGAPQLETADSSVGSVIDERRLMELPQRGGNPLELERLSPGVVNLTTMRIMKLSSPDGTSSVTVNGTGNFSTQYNMDGISDTTNDRGRGYARVAFIPPSGAIVDFKLQSNPYDATVGHVFGPVINVSSRGGTNALHGNVYYWVRNSAFDAMNFFDNKAGLSKVVYQDHRYGLSAGAPVVIPGLYNGRNKTFWFYSWEENRFTQPSTSNQTSTVPTAAERVGDFSGLLAVGNQYQVYNPFTTRAAASGRYQRDPFPGNIIPKNLISSLGQNLAAIYPLPSQRGTVDGINNFYYPDLRTNLNSSHLARVDQTFNPNHRAFVRFNRFHFANAKDLMGVAATKNLFDQFNRGVAIDDVIVASPSLILNFRYGLISAESLERRKTQGTDLGALGFSPGLTSLVDPQLATVPRMAVGAFSTLSNWSDGDGLNTAITHNLVALATKLKGSHTWRFGVDLRLFRTFGNRYPAVISPDLSFPNTYTRGPLDNSTAAPVGQELASMLVGITGGSMTRSASYAAQNKYMGLFFQDDWKLTPRLTLNLGLRYEMEWPVTERFDRLAAGFDATSPSPIDAQARANYAKSPIPELPATAFSARGGLTFVNQNGSSRSPYNRNSGQWLPRLGLAYQLTPGTVIRSGYGVYFDSLGVDRFIPAQTGFAQQTPIQASLDSGVTYVARVNNPFPNGLLTAQGAAGGLRTNLGQAITPFDPTLSPAYSQRWSFGVQRFLPGQLLLDTSYVANRSTNLSVSRNINATPAQYLSKLAVRDQPTINSLTQQFPNPFLGLATTYPAQMSRADLLRPFPQFGDITMAQSAGYSWYHSLQVRVDKRFAKGFTLQVGYTYSKYMQATEFLNPTDPVPYRSISDLDRPQVFTISGVWELPFGRGRRFGAGAPAAVNAVLGGWQVNTTVIRQAGAPLGFGNAIFNGNLKDIPLPKSERRAERWFNTNAGFNKVSSQQLANAIRTFPLRFSGVRSDGQASWNFSLLKDFRFWERVSAQFRAELYNAANHPSFDVPNTTPTNSSFGMSTQAVSEPRNWQFALRFKF